MKSTKRHAEQNKYIIWLNHAEDHMYKYMGGKASNLARVIRAGFPVPNGFCITTEAFNDFLSKLDGLKTDGDHSTTNERFLAEVSTTPLPSNLKAQILEAYRSLTKEKELGVKIAVRSSESLEDLPQASFAGQYKSYLNIEGEEALFEAIQQCWASVLSARVLAYKEHHGVDLNQYDMAVIVQQMIIGELAGVLFTIDPTTSASDRILIEAVPGIGADFISGSVTPARYVIDRSHLCVIESDGLIIPNTFSSSKFWKPLVELALLIESYFGNTQDIEWVFCDGQFWILQARPIMVKPARCDRTMLTRANIGEVMPGVVTPLSLSTFIRSLQLGESKEQEVRPSEMLTVMDGRVYIDVRGLWNSYSGILGVNPVIVLSKGIGCCLKGQESELAAAKPDIGFFGTATKTAYVWLEILTMSWVKPRLTQNLHGGLKQKLNAIQVQFIDDLLKQQIWTELQTLLDLTSHSFQLHMQASFIALCAYASLRDKLARIAGESIADRLISIANPSLENMASFRSSITMLAAEAKASPEISKLFFDTPEKRLLQTLSDSSEGRYFLEKVIQLARMFGDRASQEFELYTPRWSEDPRSLLIALRAFVVDEIEQQDTATASTDAGCRPKLTDILNRVSWPRRWLVQHLHSTFVAYSKLREETKSVLMTCFAETRRRYLNLGARLNADGYLTQPEDIFFLTLEEVQALLMDAQGGNDYREVARERKVTYEKHKLLDCPSTGGSLDENTLILRGTAVSGGRITGRARLVSDPASSFLQQGEILVTEYTDPGWMPLFLIAGAIVTEIGGTLSHTATLARETNKPAVFSVVEATRLIREGQLITVDGSTGEIYLHSEGSIL